jgi:FG-GAP-like repeat
MAAIFWNTGVSGNWSQASNWSSNTVPNDDDSATINAAGTYTVTVDGTEDGANSIVFDAPAATISIPSGDALFALSGGATITGGTIDGPGEFYTEGVTSINAGAPLTLGGGLTWDNSFRNSLNDSSAIDIGDAAGLTATIVNIGTFNLTNDTAGIGLNTVNVSGSTSSGIGNFENEGTLAKTGGTGTSHFSASYTTEAGATISVSTGTLEFDGPSNAFGGTISGTGTIAFGAGNNQISIDPTISNFRIDGGSVSFTNTLSYAGNFTETAGSLALTGSPTFSGTFSLTGGTVNFNSGNTLTLPTTTSFMGGTITGGTVALNATTTVDGSTVVQAAVANNGTIAVNAETLHLVDAVTGNGQITINNGAGVELGQASASTQTVNFASSGTGTLKIDLPSAFDSPITDFQTTNKIDLVGLTATAALYSDGDLTLFNGTAPVEQLTVSTPYSRNLFNVTPDGSGGTFVTVSPPPAVPIPSDFNADGYSDILWQNTGGQAAIWEMHGTNSIGGGLAGANPGPSWQVKGSGDFYDNGHSDILWQNTDGQAAIWEMNGASVIGGGTLATNPGPSWQVIGTGDFYGNGYSDILWQNTDGQAAIWEMNGTNVIGGGLVGADPGSSWQVIGTGDFNGDGKSDILWQNSSSGQVAIWEMDGASALGGGIVGNPGPSWHAVGTGDFNDDGLSDILFQNTSGQLAIWEMNGTSVIGGGTLATNPGPSWHVVGTGNYNGSGPSDILFQSSSGEAAIWEMNGTSVIGGGSIGNPGPTWHI